LVVLVLVVVSLLLVCVVVVVVSWWSSSGDTGGVGGGVVGSIDVSSSGGVQSGGVSFYISPIATGKRKDVSITVNTSKGSQHVIYVPPRMAL
jgi:hypothetical protein